MKEFGFNSLIVVDRDNTIIAGHARWEAAKRAGYEEVQVLVASHLNPAQLRAYRIADNRLAEDAEWNETVLKIEFAELSAPDLDFNLEYTGFSTGEIDFILDGDAQSEEPEDEMPPPPRAAAITRAGDLWGLGPHSLICADARAPETYVLLLAGDKARLIIADPPYNVAVDGHVSGLGRTKHREFAMASGEMQRPQFVEFLATSFSRLAENSVDGALHYLFMDHRHIEEMAAAGAVVYDERKNLLVWVKTNGGMGSMYRSQHELIFVFKHGTAPHINNVELGVNGRYRTNVFEYPGANTFTRNRNEELARHPTPKPVALIADLIRDASRIGDLVLDCFVGGGTIFIAAEKTRRRAAGVEIDPIYCDLAVER
jgi:DNA modification methylase